MSNFEATTAAANGHEGLSEEVYSQVEDVRARLSAGIPQFIAICFPMAETPALEWLAAQPRHPKFYWRNRTATLEIAGFGSAFAIGEADPEQFAGRVEEALALCADHPQGDLFTLIGGTKFDPHEAPSLEWREFPGLLFTQPEVALVRNGAWQQLVITVPIETSEATSKIVRRVEREFSKLKAPKRLDSPFPAIERKTDLPAYENWNELCNQVLQRLQNEGLSKIVLARKQDCALSAPLNPYAAVKQLQQDNPGTFAFVCAPSALSSFAAVTPECLFRLWDDTIEADALGGTAKRFADTRLDDAAGAGLFSSKKITAEHQLVVDDVHAKLRTLTECCTSDAKPQLVRFSHVQHLLTRFSGPKKPGISAADVLFGLSPTSAVSGNPSWEARQAIAQLEPFVRGWYAGPVGLISRDTVEFAVALRCMLIQGSQVSFFAGAGIVADSSSFEEWEEIESKISSATRLFDGA